MRTALVGFLVVPSARSSLSDGKRFPSRHNLPVRVHVHKVTPLSLDPKSSPSFGEDWFDVSYDNTALVRALDLVAELERQNYRPTSIVAGPRAFLSIVAHLQYPSVEENLSAWSVFDHSGSTGVPLLLAGTPVELDMTTHDENDLRVTCRMDGMAWALKRTRVE